MSRDNRANGKVDAEQAKLEKPRQSDDDRKTGYNYELPIDDAAAFHNDDSKEEKRLEKFYQHKS